MSGFAISCAVNDSKHRNLFHWLVDHIDDDIGPFHELARSFDQTWSADMGKAGDCKPVDASANSAHQFARRPRAVIGNPVEYVVEFTGGGLVDENLHSPRRCRNRSLNSSSVS